MSMYWRQTWVRDPQARAIADRHYYRKSVGHVEFAPPGQKVVLVLPNYRALWVTQRAMYERGDTYRRDGLECWNCVVFRNESSRLASVLIRQAVEATLAAWRAVPLPRDGFITFIDRAAVAQPLTTGQPYGWTWLQCGWTQREENTKVHDYLAFQLSRDQLAALQTTARPAPSLQGQQAFDWTVAA